MEPVIIKPKQERLKPYIQYFLFFRKTSHEAINYTTFPNNNLCLALYRRNTIQYTNDAPVNHCSISKGGSSLTGRFYGFHKMPFRVDIDGPLDQVCIIFYPAALRAFTGEHYNDLMHADSFFNELFAPKDACFLEQLFDQDTSHQRAALLEQLLLQRLQEERIPLKLREALHYIATHKHGELPGVEQLSKQLQLSEATLFRLFKNHLGQNPKSYLNTVRFRKAMDQLLQTHGSLTDMAYENQYYDQAHFIRDFKTFSGYAPGKLAGAVSIRQNDLAWIYNRQDGE